MLDAMSFYRASIRSQQNSQLDVQLPQFSLSGNGPTSDEPSANTSPKPFTSTCRG
ncbi:hypothetical protein AZE42_05862 [Rhizopogon vesiculosus]|uniref:Uncharacterized protein n=1 Tax=Rhizopogon vesiculosus TaxID=180088 RepID=A0A1J8RE23_9AGAM|nr:hypothetical protein AZE42_05862 [Rhizopogon vesiculosus]